MTGGLGKVATKLGRIYPKFCFLPPVGTALCPVFKKSGKLLTKIGLAGKKYVPTAFKIFPKLLLKDLKSALTANPITATKALIKDVPKIVKIWKPIKVLG